MKKATWKRLATWSFPFIWNTVNVFEFPPYLYFDTGASEPFSSTMIRKK